MTVLLVQCLLAWAVASVPVALLVGRLLRGRAELVDDPATAGEWVAE